MSSQALLCKLKLNNSIATPGLQYEPGLASSYNFYAESNKGTFLNTKKRACNQITFVCRHLHVFDLHDQDIQMGRWCSECAQTHKNRRRCSFYVSYNEATDKIHVNCESGHVHQLNLDELKEFKSCPRCTVGKREITDQADKAKHVEEDIYQRELKNYETMFIEAYKRLLEAFPLIKKLPTTDVVSVYFENELYYHPGDHQPNSMAVHLILEHKNFITTIFHKLNDHLRKRFFHKIVAGISPVTSLEPKTTEALRFVQSLLL